MVTGLLLAFGRPSARAKFDSMLTACTLSPKAIEFIDDKKMRILFHGVNAAAANEEIREAFEIVYEDLGPVRVAGDLIFGRLNRIASEANERSATLADIGDGDAALDALSTTRALFDVLDSDSSGRLDRDELLGSSELLALIRGSQPSDFSDEAAVDSFLCKADSDGDGQVSCCICHHVHSLFASDKSFCLPQVSFLEFCLHCSSSAGEMADEAVQAALESAVMRRHESQSESTKPTAQRGRKMTTSERFDEMLTTCMEWEVRDSSSTVHLRAPWLVILRAFSASCAGDSHLLGVRGRPQRRRVRCGAKSL